MYHYVAGITLLKSLSPYFRKHILTTLHSHELLFLQTLFISILVFCYFLYKWIFHKAPLQNIGSLHWTQLLCIFMIAIVSVFSSILLFEIDKKYNTPMLNVLFMRVASTIALLLVGIFLFKERYSFWQILGLTMIVLGIYLVGSKDKE